MEQMIVAVDPGREKCGIALVSEQCEVIKQEVVPTGRLKVFVEELITAYPVRLIVIGDGTSSQEAKSKLEEIIVNGKSTEIVLVDERHSTDEARKLYWRKNPPTGFMKLIPVTMRVPPGPVDDYVAVILAERYFDKKD